MCRLGGTWESQRTMPEERQRPRKIMGIKEKSELEKGSKEIRGMRRRTKVEKKVFRTKNEERKKNNNERFKYEIGGRKYKKKKKNFELLLTFLLSRRYCSKVVTGSWSNGRLG